MTLAVAVPDSAPASGRAEEREGAEILRSIKDGERECGSLSTRDYERIGEYAMGRMVGSPAAHESMDRLMAQMMGERGEEQMHVLMGRRFSGCGGGRIPRGLGGMMGMIGMMGGGFAPGGGQGPPVSGVGPGEAGFPGMMGARDFRDDDDGGGWGPAAIVMTALMLLFLALAVAALLFWRPWHRDGRGTSPLEVLQERFARGEIDTEEYRRLREALGGGL